MLYTNDFSFSQNIGATKWQKCGFLQTMETHTAPKLIITIFMCILSLYHTIPTLNSAQKRSIWKDIVGKEGNAGNQHFSFSHNVF